MIRISDKPSTLVICDIPAGHFVGYFVLSIFSVAILASILNSYRDTVTYLVSLVTVVAASLFFLYRLGTTPITETKIDRVLRTIAVSKRGILLNRFKVYPFDRVEGGALVNEVLNNEISRSIDLLLSDGEKVELVMFRGSDAATVLKTAEMINEYVGIRNDLGNFELTLLPKD